MQILRDARQQSFLEVLQASLQKGEVPLRRDDAERMLDLLRSPLGAFSRHTYEPGHFTASAFVLSPDRSKLLLIRHRKLGMWLQPGGHIESTDRDLVSAARRELSEETGLSGALLLAPLYDVDVHQIPPFGDSPAHLHHDVRCVFAAETEFVVAADDAADARWFHLEQIVDSSGVLADGLGTDESVRRVARRLEEFRAGVLPDSEM